MTHRVRRRLTRRTFLRGLGGAAVSLPLLNLSMPGVPGFGSARAEGQALPKRFVFFIHPNGVVTDSWFPESPSSESAFALRPVHAPLADFKEKMILLRGVNMECSSVGPGEPHQTGMGGILTGRPLQEGDFVGGDGSRAGWGDGISLDQHLATTMGLDVPIPSLQLGVRADSHGGSEVRTRISYSGPGMPNPPMNDPMDVYKTVFSDLKTDPEELARVRAERRSVLDTVGSQYASLLRRVGSEDRERLERHFSLIRDMEGRLDTEAITGAACSAPATPEDLEPDSEDTMPQITTAHMDMLALALACDLTRVVTIQFSNAKNHIRFPWIDSLGDGHGLSHAGNSNVAAIDEWVRRDTWYAKQVAYLAKKLDSIEEGDGTMLDNTVIVWTSEIARGNTHSQKNMPFMLLGSAGGHFKTGRYVEYSTSRSHNDLLVSLLHAFGGEDETFGDERFCTGPLPNLT